MSRTIEAGPERNEANLAWTMGGGRSITETTASVFIGLIRRFDAWCARSGAESRERRSNRIGRQEGGGGRANGNPSAISRTKLVLVERDGNSGEFVFPSADSSRKGGCKIGWVAK